MQSLIRAFQAVVMTSVLASGLFVVEQMAAHHFNANPYAPPHNPYVAVGQMSSTVMQGAVRLERQMVTDITAFLRYGAE